MTRMQLLLLDLDDVLLFSRGYRAALRGAVAYFGRRLGYSDVPLSDDDVDIFEAYGLTAEWDSATLCISLLLAQVWEMFPGDATMLGDDRRSPPSHRLPVPQFRSFISGLGTPNPGRHGPLEAAEAGILQRHHFLSTGQRTYLQELLRNTRSFEHSPVHRLIQEFNHGSRRYAELYGAQPLLAIEGTLVSLDRPRLDAAQRERLREWIERPEHGAAIFTNRPSTPPDGAFDAPEAELGIEACGLTNLKVAGGGGLAWISQQRGLRSGDLLKPSPVHALVALRLALGDSLKSALQASVGLALDGKPDSEWARLDGSVLHVFEDSAKGIRSAVAAVDVLRANGVMLDCALYGISDSPPKRTALASAGASLFPSIQDALAGVQGLERINS
jgi:hypothetical protein